MFGLDPKDAALVITSAIAAIALVIAYFKFDDWRESRKREAMKDSTHFAEEGVPFLPEFLECYAFDDRSGMFNAVKSAVKAWRDPAQRKMHLDNFLKKQLERAVVDPKKREVIVAIVDAAVKATEVSAAAAAAAPAGPVAAAVAGAAAALS